MRWAAPTRLASLHQVQPHGNWRRWRDYRPEDLCSPVRIRRGPSTARGRRRKLRRSECDSSAGRTMMPITASFRPVGRLRQMISRPSKSMMRFGATAVALALAGAADSIAATPPDRRRRLELRSHDALRRQGPGLFLRQLRACASNRARRVGRLARLQSELSRGADASRSGRALSSDISPSGVAGIRSGAWP